jgi:chorismate mutase
VKLEIRLIRRLIVLTILLCSSGVTACAQDVEQEPPRKEAKPVKAEQARPPADPNKFAVIITGLGGEEAYVKQFAAWGAELRRALIERLAFAENQVTLLTEKPTGQEVRANADEVRQVFATLRTVTKPDSSVFIFFIGHGSFDGKQAKFNLVGPDLSADDYAALIKLLLARRVVTINLASASGEFIKPLSANGRITITATRSGQEQNATRLAEHFIAALSNPEADADKNNRISVLEAFNYATKLTADWYQKEGRLATEHALIDDNGDGTGHQKAEAGDGALAKTTYFDSLPAQQAAGDAELVKLFAERARLEGEVEQLKARKEQMKDEEYEAALEKLLVELAKVNQSIKAKQK